MAGMREVARVAGVSLSTVSIVLSESDKYVSPEIREKVLEAARKTGYVLKPRKRAEKTIAVILPSISSTFFSNLLRGIEEALSGQGYALMVCDSEFQYEKEKQFIGMIKKQELCGVIIDSSCPENQEEAYAAFLKEKYGDSGIPVVFLERRSKEESFGSVFVDHYGNAYQAVSHLISQGHRDIAHIGGIPGNIASRERTRGYYDALRGQGVEPDADLADAGDFSPNSGYLAMKRLLQHGKSFTAVFAANDQMAIGAMKAVLSAGKRIPEDVAVIGIDNLSVSTMVSPALSTINVPTFQMGKEAVRLMLEMREGVAAAQIQIPCGLIVRKSTDPAAGSEWELRGW